MNYVLVKLDDSWADEFDMNGFVVTTQANWEQDLETIRAFFESKEGTEVEVYFGTNECMRYEDYDEFFESLIVKSLLLHEAETLNKLFYNDEDQKEVIDFTYGLGGDVVRTLLEKAADNEGEEDED